MTGVSNMVPRLYLLAANTARARAYFYFMQLEGIAPSHVVLLQTGGAPAASIQPRAASLFDNVTPLYSSVIESGIPHQCFDTSDVNSEDVCSALAALPAGIVVYAPASGLLAKVPLFETGHKLLHVHPGRLPDFKGSTPMYYSLLAEQNLSASAIFLEPEIDAGPILAQRDFPLPSDLRCIDTEYDPYIRALLLIQVLKEYYNGLTLTPMPQGAGGTTYHVIHPVLKHLALLGGAVGARKQENCL